MIRYFDASALAKRYVQEAGSPQISRLLAKGHPATSRLSEVEVASALSRRAREGVIKTQERDRALEALQRDMSAFYVVEIIPAVTTQAIHLLTRYRLRSADALQLASSLFLQNSLQSEVEFVAFDQKLMDVAHREGLTVWQPSQS